MPSIDVPKEMGDDLSISDAAPRSFPRNVKLY